MLRVQSPRDIWRDPCPYPLLPIHCPPAKRYQPPVGEQVPTVKYRLTQITDAYSFMKQRFWSNHVEIRVCQPHVYNKDHSRP